MPIWNCGKFGLPLGKKTYVMGIVNATPDSFSGDGVTGEAMLRQALQMVEDGADLLDIGGESTRPGAEPVPAQEEKRRILPVLERLVAKVSVPVSIDTTKAEVARAAIEAGASIINDISGATFDADMLETLAGANCGVVLMHLRGTPQAMKWSERFAAGTDEKSDLIAEITAFWRERIEAAQKAGISSSRLCLDAGFGFGKSYEENLELLRRGRELREFGYPVLSATSRKSTIGKALGDLPVQERLWGTAATVALAIAGGADIVRVHDVREMAQVARVTDATLRG